MSSGGRLATPDAMIGERPEHGKRGGLRVQHGSREVERGPAVNMSAGCKNVFASLTSPSTA